MIINCLECNDSKEISDAAATYEAMESVPWEEQVNALCHSQVCGGTTQPHKVITAGT